MGSRSARRTRPYFDREKADRAVAFFSSLKHSIGEWAGKPFMLMDWQADLIRRAFGTMNADGTRQYRTVYVEIPRKNGKTEVGAGVALNLLTADDEPGAQVYSAAGDREQAGLIYTAAVPMVEQAPALNKRLRIIESRRRIVYHATKSFYQVLSAEAYSKFGINAHGILFDELHTQPDRGLWDALTTSVGARRQPLNWVMTTAGIYDVNSIAWEQHNYACKVRDGIIQDPTFLPVIYAAPDDADWTDEDVWRAANPALGVFRSIEEMRSNCKKAQLTPAQEMPFRRFYLNQWVNAITRWLPIEAWDECAAAIDLEVLRGRPCYLGLDLSSTTDLTALALLFPRADGTYDVLCRFWIPEVAMEERERRDRVPYSLWVRQGLVTATPGNIVDYDYILREIEGLLGLYDIRELAFDRWGSQKIVTDLVKLGFQVDPKVPGPKLVQFGQGFASMSAPTKELMTLVLGKKVRHGGNPVLRWNVDNLVVAQDPAGNLKPDKGKATQRIDGAVAVIMALDRASRHQQDAGRSVYDERGILTT